ncbi:MAG: hypothetical protein IE919_08930 [Thioclava sp.]|nr:DUF6455 family protein [Thioclava sp.]MBD3803353.1 hypothetical protein [Thioclava sp.]
MCAAKNLNRHAAMMNRMAQLMGADLSAEMAQGRLSAEGWKDALVRCTECRDPEACVVWLSENDPEQTPSHAPPSYCENRLMMSRLRDAARARTEGVE